MAKKERKFYAYKIDSTSDEGVVDNWDECKDKVIGVAAKYKSFLSEKEAKDWLKEGAKYAPKEKKVRAQVSSGNLEQGIYSDAGTGRGEGVEVKVTDKNGMSLLDDIISRDKITKYDTYNLGKGVTNNFGELTGCYLALKLAIKTGEKSIFMDSKLVLNYWSFGHVKLTMDKSTRELALKVKMLRYEFEKMGGKLKFVSGDINPADLGFHK